MKNKLEEVAVVLLAGAAIVALLATLFGLDVAFTTKVLHQPAKCVFTKCVTVLKP